MPRPISARSVPFGLSSGLLAASAAVAACFAGAGSALAQCVSAPGNCLIPHPTPGCESPECCEQVCFTNPDCCDTAWDEFCVQLASKFCQGLCGAGASGDCFSSHQNPSCNDLTCCQLICTIDPFCCQELWDTTCAVTATFLCEQTPGVCGAPGTGSCFESHPNGACSNEACCLAVCGIDPGCCSGAWDFACVLLASELCDLCQVSCPPGASFESEACLLRLNDPCVFPTAGAAPETLACGATRCGLITSIGGVPDVDVYAVTVVDEDGDGLVRIKLELNSAFKSFAAILPAGCAPLASASTFAASVNCVSGFADLCVPEGTWLVAVTSGLFPTPADEGTDCFSDGFYTITLHCVDDCVAPCGPASESCFEPHVSPGCNDVACCEAICAVDAFCCEGSWDINCVLAAVTGCDGELPTNDLCAECVAIGEGAFDFSTIGATTSGPPLPQSCNEGFGVSFESDIWFCYTPSCSGSVSVRTCGASFDTRLAVYRGTCSNLTLVACNDDSLLCLPNNTSRLAFIATCDESYLIRVGGFDTAIGVGTLVVECGLSDPCATPCPGDLDGSGTIDGGDLGLLLGSWNTSSPVADLDGSGLVDGGDLGILLGGWGACP